MRNKIILKSLILTMSLSLFTVMPNKSAFATEAEPNIIGQAAITVDYESGEVIYSKDADIKHYPASTTKLLTGLLLAENKQKSDMLTYTQDAKDQPAYSLDESFMGGKIKVGDKISSDDIMKGLLLFSGNDTAYVISDNIAGNYKSFADLMNKKAKELGANNSNFVNPNGLHNDDHYTTAYDLSLITKAAFENDWERTVMQLKSTPIYVNNAKIIVENRNLTLNQNGNIGGKTGYTGEAGGCLATVYERNGRKIVGIVLKSRQVDNADMSKFNDMDSIMDYSFSKQKEVYKKNGEQVDNISIEYKPFGIVGPTKTIEVPVKLTQDVMYYKNAINDNESKIVYNKNEDNSAWDLIFNKDLKLQYTTRNHTEDVTGVADISFSHILKDNILIYMGSIVGLIILITLIISLINLTNNKRRNSRRSSYRRRGRR